MTRALALALLLGGCASTDVACTDLTNGVCTVSSKRLLTDSSVALTEPKTGLQLNFSSKPNEAGTAAAFAALNSTIGILTKLIPAPVPALASPPPEPALTPGLYEGPRGYRRELLDTPAPGLVRYRSEGGTEHVVSVADWRLWVHRPLP